LLGELITLLIVAIQELLQLGSVWL